MIGKLDIDLLQTLVAFADTGSFAKAANAVHRTQSAVSMQMKRLEDLVDERLFEKSGRRSVLTPQGQNLLVYARRILALHDEALSTFRDPDVHGEVRIGVCDDYVLHYMPPILTDYTKHFPHVHVRLDAEPSVRLIAATTSGDYDLALVNLHQFDIEHEELCRDQLVWVTSAQHLVHERRPVPLAVETQCLWGRWGRQALERAGIDYRLACSTFNLSGLATLIGAGLAVGVMSRSSVPDGLRVLGEMDGFPSLPMTPIALISNPAGLSPAAARLAEGVRSAFSRSKDVEAPNLRLAQ